MSRGAGVTETDVDLERKLRSAQTSFERNSDAIVDGLLADRGARDGVGKKGDAVLAGDSGDLAEQVDETRNVGWARSQEVHVLGSAMRAARPERKEHRAFEDERPGVARLSEAEEQPLKAIAQENEVEIFATLLG
jgi:hypothetical protein